MAERMDRRNEATPIKDLAHEVIDADEGRERTATASRVWYAANGDFEHRHTVGVFLKEDPKGNPPTLVVYTDTNAIIQDFSANKEIYIARLANQDFFVSDIRFRLSKYRKKNPGSKRRSENLPEGFGPDYTPEDLTEGITLTPEELEDIAQSVEKLPESLRETVFQARVSSAKANKGSGSRNH